MFNVAVVNVKETLKYLVKVTIVLCLVMFASKCFSNDNKNSSSCTPYAYFFTYNGIWYK